MAFGMHDFFAFVGSVAVAVSWLLFGKLLAARNMVPPVVSRKLAHIGTGPLFLVCWGLYSDGSYAKYVAASVPAILTFQFFLVGVGFVKDEDFVRSISRSGSRQELLKGPLTYGLVHVLAAVAFWRHNRAGVLSVLLLCLGDGFADVIGRQYGTTRLPWHATKTVAGSVAFFVSSLVGMVAYVSLFDHWAWFLECPALGPSYWLRLVILAGGATLVEGSLSHEWDNVCVFVAAVAGCYLLAL